MPIDLAALRRSLHSQRGYAEVRRAMDKLESPLFCGAMTDSERRAFIAYTVACALDQSDIIATLKAHYSATYLRHVDPRLPAWETMDAVLRETIKRGHGFWEVADMREQWKADGSLRWVSSAQLARIDGLASRIGGRSAIGRTMSRLGWERFGSNQARLADGSRTQRWSPTDEWMAGHWRTA